MIKDAFVYPFRGAGPVMLVIGTLSLLFFGVARWAPVFGGIAALLGAAYLATFFLDVIGTTVSGGEEVPDWPSIADGWEDVVFPYLRVVVSVACGGLPLLAVGFLVPESEAFFDVAFFGAVVLGAMYVPMALLNAAVYQTFESVLPHRVLPGIWKCMPSYLISAGLVVVLVLVGGAAVMLGERTAYVGWVFGAALSFYFMLVQARFIGMIYRKNEMALEE
ncbi:hypothetical protein FEM03_19030 [Phragmitibacter flavus]|uniref:DUF4013 domain-containing protein n=2 Tax=Phragmitibacter flavus TaxID=2576071 RepID=A0A5R8KB95_9BACT|nr:hypothetical protein FEM03_19030 [Phragmitibacter flavus]